MRKHIIKGRKYPFLLPLLAVLFGSATSKDGACLLTCVETDNGCKVCFQSCPQDNQTVYLFDSCTQTSLSIGNNSSQGESTSVSYGVADCGLHCCDSKFDIFQNPAITSCPSTAASQSQVFIIVIAILTVIFVVLCCLVSGNARIR
jgi:hypothetical protein